MTVRVFPVWHHSPSAARCLAELIEQDPPRAVLVEGPSDADHLIDAITHPGTEPPVAILAYLPGGGLSTIYPLVTYSPEHAALVAAKKHNLRVGFCDLPASRSLARQKEQEERLAELIEVAREEEEEEAKAKADGEEEREEEREEEEGKVEAIEEAKAGPDEVGGDVEGGGSNGGDDEDEDENEDDDEDVNGTQLTRERAMELLLAEQSESSEYIDEIPETLGFSSFDEFWESSFEMPSHTPDEYVRLALEFGRLVRSHQADKLADNRESNRVRERHMRERVKALMEEGYRDDEILVVCGAFHAAAFVDDDILDDVECGPEPLECELTVIPYSFVRMSSQVGYGAGNRAPLFYQAVHDRKGDFERATLETLVNIAEQLRVRGHSASLADVIDATRLANLLARMREKVGPGLTELREATVACMLQGNDMVLEGIWERLLIGSTIGKVASTIGRTSLQEEFHREVETRKIPASDESADFWLHMTSGAHVGTSVFLHRLRVAQVPFAHRISEGRGVDLLSQVREKWTTQWTPATEIALIEKVVLGQTLSQVCENLLVKALQETEGVAQASRIMLEAAVCDLSGMYQEALTLVEHASTTGDLYELALACQNLAALLSYGMTRDLDPGYLGDLLTRLFNRAISSLTNAGYSDDEGAKKLCTGLKILHEVHTNHARDNDLFLQILRWAAGNELLHPMVSGLSTSLLHLGRNLEEDELEAMVRSRIGGGADPVMSAHYLGGLLSINRSALVKNRAIIELLDGLICALTPEPFVQVMPIFRRSLADLSRAELGYLLENVFLLHDIARRKEAADLVSRADLESLREADSELKDMTDSWEELF